MTEIDSQVRAYLPRFFNSFPFDQLSSRTIQQLVSRLQVHQWRSGELIYQEGELPSEVHCIVQGQIRILGSTATGFPTLEKLSAGVVGWDSLLRRVSAGTLRATDPDNKPTITLSVSADDFEALLLSELLPRLSHYCSLLELHDVLSCFLAKLPVRTRLPDLRRLCDHIYQHQLATVQHWSSGSKPDLPEAFTWFVSSGGLSAEIGTLLTSTQGLRLLQSSPFPVRLIGVDQQFLATVLETGTLPTPGAIEPAPATAMTTPIVPLLEKLLVAPSAQAATSQSIAPASYPVHLAHSDHGLELAISAFWMACDALRIPYSPDTFRDNQRLQRWFAQKVSTELKRMEFYCDLAQFSKLKAQQINFAPTSGGLNRLQTPAIIALDGVPCVLYEINATTAIIGSPTAGLLNLPVDRVVQQLEVEANGRGVRSHALILDRQPTSPLKQFGWQWLWNYIKPERGILIQILIASMFVQLLQLANPLLTQQIIDKVVINGGSGALPSFGLLLIILTVLESVLDTLRTWLLNDSTNRVDLQLGQEIVQRIVKLPLAFIQKHSVGELASRVGELETVRKFFTNTFLTVVLDVLFSFIYIGVMLLYSVKLTLCVLAAIPLVIGLTLGGALVMKQLLRTKAEQNSMLQSFLIERLSGIYTVKAQSMEGQVEQVWCNQYAEYLRTGSKAALASAVLRSSNKLLNNLNSLMVLWVGSSAVLSGQLTLGGLIAFRIIAGYVTGPLLRLAGVWQNLQETLLAIERLSEIVDTLIEGGSGLTMPPIVGRVQFAGIDFGFNAKAPLQLSNISLDIPARIFVGLAGQSGSGKSTLLKLLPRFYLPLAGSIYIDNYDLSRVDVYSLRQQMGIVPQESALFEGTIRENITSFQPGFSDEEVIEAAKIAEAHRFILEKPQGYDTKVDERGASLSGGEKQRIAIARMVLQNPRLVILDEATSALDYEIEQRIVENLQTKFKGRTVFFITHRLANLTNADLIVYLRNGQIVEQGTHAELMRNRQFYYSLYSQQVYSEQAS